MRWGVSYSLRLMDEEILYGACCVLSVWFAPLVVALVVAVTLSQRVRRLERRIEALAAAPRAAALPTPSAATPEPEAPVVEVPAAPAPADTPAKADPPVPPPPAPPRPARRPSTPSFLEDLTLERVVVWMAAGLGGLLAVVAALLALVAAIDRGWLGPAARVSAGLAIGVSLWVVGSRVRRVGHRWGASALAGAGIGTLYGSLFAAASLYDLIPSLVASVGMIAVTALGAARAIRHDDRFLGWLALVGGVLTPILVSSGSNDALQLFAYLALLCAGFVLAAVQRAWWDIVVGAAVMVAGMHLAWTTEWYAPDQARDALLGVLLLSLPFAGAAVSQHRWVHVAGIGTATGVLALALPWVVPVDPWFTDPRTGEQVARTVAGSLPTAAWAAVVLPLPLIAVGRWRGGWVVALAGACAAGALAMVFALGWTVSHEPADAWLVWGAVGAAVVGSLVTARSRSALGVVVAVGAAGVALAIAQVQLEGLALVVGLLALAAAGAGVARSSGWGGAVAVAVPALCLPLVVADPRDLGVLWTVGAACLVLMLTAQLPLLVRWRSAPRWAYGAAALSGVLLFVPLYRSWLLAFDDVGVGLLPLLLGANALLGASVLLRRGVLSRREVVTAVFVAVVLLGVVAAVPLQLEARWLTVVWALEAAALAWADKKLDQPLLRAGVLVLCAMVGVRLVLNPFALSWGTASEGWPILNWTLYSWGLPLLCVLYVAHRMPRFAPALNGLAALIGFALVNVQVSHAFQDTGPLELGGSGLVQSMVRSASWAGYGLTILGIGLWRDVRWVRLVGFGFVLLATVKVFVFDLWGLSGFVRVGSVACLAVSLLVAALLFERIVLRGVSRGAEET